MANLLVSRGANIDLEDTDGVTPLNFALQQRNVNMLQIILNQHHLVVTAERKDFAADLLLSAVDYEVEEAVRLVVEGGYTPVTVCNAKGETPLHRAIVKQNPQMMELLMDLDAAISSLTTVTITGDSPAHYAAQFGSISEMRPLLRYLTRIFGDLQELDDAINPLNDTNQLGLTCLYVAGTSGSTIDRRSSERDAIVRLLLQHGARLFPRDCVLHDSNPNQLLLHERVRRGMVLWIQDVSDWNHQIESDDEEEDGVEARPSNRLLTELCAEWVASVASLPTLPASSDFSAVLMVMISTGYACDTVPLLLEVPLLRTATPSLLRRLDRFARSPHEHSLLLELHAELLQGLSEEVTET